MATRKLNLIAGTGIQLAEGENTLTINNTGTVASGSSIYEVDGQDKTLKDLEIWNGAGRSYNANFSDYGGDSYMVIPKFNESSHDDDDTLLLGWTKNDGFDFYKPERVITGIKNNAVFSGRKLSGGAFEGPETDEYHFITAVIESAGGGPGGGGTLVYGMFYKWKVTENRTTNTFTVTYKSVNSDYTYYTIVGTGTTKDDADNIIIDSWILRDSREQE